MAGHVDHPTIAEAPAARIGARPGRRARAIRFVKRLGGEILDDRIPDVGAMMAYYAVLALFPMLVVVVTISSLVIDASTVQEGIAMVTGAMPESTRAYLAEAVAKFMDAASANFAIGGAALALWGASRGAVSLSTALNSIYNVRETRSWLRRQLVAIGVTIVVALVAVIALGLLVVGPIAGHWVSDRFGYGDAFDTAWNAGRWIGAGLIMMVLWGFVYRVLPNAKLPFRIFTPGAVFGVFLWLAISWAFSLYLGHFDRYETTYGALGTAIVFLTWLWLSNIALLVGAEINDVLARPRG